MEKSLFKIPASGDPLIWTRTKPKFCDLTPLQRLSLNVMPGKLSLSDLPLPHIHDITHLVIITIDLNPPRWPDESSFLSKTVIELLSLVFEKYKSTIPDLMFVSRGDTSSVFSPLQCCN